EIVRVDEDVTPGEGTIEGSGGGIDGIGFNGDAGGVAQCPHHVESDLHRVHRIVGEVALGVGDLRPVDGDYVVVDGVDDSVAHGWPLIRSAVLSPTESDGSAASEEGLGDTGGAGRLADVCPAPGILQRCDIVDEIIRSQAVDDEVALTELLAVHDGDD